MNKCVRACVCVCVSVYTSAHIGYYFGWIQNVPSESSAERQDTCKKKRIFVMTLNFLQ